MREFARAVKGNCPRDNEVLIRENLRMYKRDDIPEVGDQAPEAVFQRILLALKHNKISFASASQAVGRSKDYIRDMKRRGSLPRAIELERLSEVLNVNMAWFVTGEHPPIWIDPTGYSAELEPKEGGAAFSVDEKFIEQLWLAIVNLHRDHGMTLREGDKAKQLARSLNLFWLNEQSGMSTSVAFQATLNSLKAELIKHLRSTG